MGRRGSARRRQRRRGKREQLEPHAKLAFSKLAALDQVGRSGFLHGNNWISLLTICKDLRALVFRSDILRNLRFAVLREPWTIVNRVLENIVDLDTGSMKPEMARKLWAKCPRL